MKLRFTRRADEDYASLPVIIPEALRKLLRFLLANRAHPSLHLKKYSEALDMWQGRVTREWRLYHRPRGHAPQGFEIADTEWPLPWGQRRR